MIKKLFRTLRSLTEIHQRLFRIVESISDLEESIKIIKERETINSVRLLHRIDALNRHIDDKHPSEMKNNVFTLYQHSDILSICNNNSYKKSYAQYNDDLVLKHIFSILEIKSPTYLDLGAHHPFELSNTALFYENGSEGVNVEANPALFKLFPEHRPRDVNLNCGVGVNPCRKKFYIIQGSPALSTFEESQISRLKRVGKKVEAVLDIDVTTVNHVVDNYCGGIFPDLLTIDIEGGDYDVLRSIDYKRTRPAVVCVEINTHDRLLRIVEIDFLLFKEGYFHFGDVGGGIEGRNAIFVDQRYIDKFITMNSIS